MEFHAAGESYEADSLSALLASTNESKTLNQLLRPSSVPASLVPDKNTSLPCRLRRVDVEKARHQQSSDTTLQTRPQAPIIRGSQNQDKFRRKISKNPRNRVAQVANRPLRSQKHSSPSEKFRSVANFDRKNPSRKPLNESLNTGDIHFLNVEATTAMNSGAKQHPELSVDKRGQGLPFFKMNEVIESSKGKTLVMPSSQFVIPTLPSGRNLSFNILSTWGDPYYVGLMGIDVFDGSGHPIVLDDVYRQLSADPPDINVLPEYDSDPRTVSNLVDGVNCTCDDLHAWLAPFTPGGNHYVNMRLNRDTVISMIRIWNYNKSRIHSYR